MEFMNSMIIFYFANSSRIRHYRLLHIQLTLILPLQMPSHTGSAACDYYFVFAELAELLSQFLNGYIDSTLYMSTTILVWCAYIQNNGACIHQFFIIDVSAAK